MTVPNPILGRACGPARDGTLDYPSENAAWIDLARYQFLVGKAHPVSTSIARMLPDDQDIIDDFLLDVASRGLSLRGQFLAHLVERAVKGAAHPRNRW